PKSRMTISSVIRRKADFLTGLPRFDQKIFHDLRSTTEAPKHRATENEYQISILLSREILHLREDFLVGTRSTASLLLLPKFGDAVERTYVQLSSLRCASEA